MTLCECGCGGEAKPGRRFINGHNVSIKKGTKLSEETRRKRLETRKINKEIKEGKRPAPELPFCKCGCGGRVTKPGNEYIYGHYMKVNQPFEGKTKENDKVLKIISEKVSKTRKEMFANGELEVWSKGKTKENDVRVKKQAETLSISKKNFYQTEEGKKFAEKTSKNKKEFYQTEEGRLFVKYHKIKLSKIMYEKWQDPEFVKMMTESWSKKPTQPEKDIDDIVQLLLPKEYKYNGNFELGITIGGKIPDFVNVNGKKKAIDVFGDHWHDGEDPQIRIDLFKEYGWDLLVIWEHELKDKDAVIQKILKFHGVKSDFALTQKTLDTWVDNNKREGGDKN